MVRASLTKTLACVCMALIICLPISGSIRPAGTVAPDHTPVHCGFTDTAAPQTPIPVPEVAKATPAGRCSSHTSARMRDWNGHPPGNLPGSIEETLPPFDMFSSDYAAFRGDMEAIVQKAERSSGIRTVYGVFIMDLRTNYRYGVNENLLHTDPDTGEVEGFFNSASVVKLFQGYILCDMMRRGELDADATFHDAVTGRRFKLPNMIKTMISLSDNNYSNAVLRLIGNAKANEVLTRLGIYDSRIYGEMSGAIGYSRKNNIEKYGTSKRCARLTPRDAGLILYNVYRGRESDYYMKIMNEALLGNIYNTRIPVGVARVDPSCQVAHKTGTNSELGIYNDAGIIYCDNPFILVAFTKGTSQGKGQGFIRSLAEQLTRYFNGAAG
jgi:hypothetical protein